VQVAAVAAVPTMPIGQILSAVIRLHLRHSLQRHHGLLQLARMDIGAVKAANI